MNQCTHCDTSKIYVKKVLISAPSCSLPRGKYWKQCTPMNSITRSALLGPAPCWSWQTNSSTWISFKWSLEHVKLFLLALQNTGGLLTLEKLRETSSYYIYFLQSGGHWGLESPVPPFGVSHPKPQEHPSLGWRGNTRGCYQHWRLASNQTHFGFFIFFLVGIFCLGFGYGFFFWEGDGDLFLFWGFFFRLGELAKFCSNPLQCEHITQASHSIWDDFGYFCNKWLWSIRGPCSWKQEGFIFHKIKEIL